MSVDGPKAIHDQLRGVGGSYERALQALEFAARAGLEPGVNTQINVLSKPHLREAFNAIVDAGAKFWQVQLTVPMGNAADNADLLLQPYEIIEAVDTKCAPDRPKKNKGRMLPLVDPDFLIIERDPAKLDAYARGLLHQRLNPSKSYSLEMVKAATVWLVGAYIDARVPLHPRCGARCSSCGMEATSQLVQEGPGEE